MMGIKHGATLLSNTISGERKNLPELAKDCQYSENWNSS
jgi:hypothetical protein